MDEHDDDVSRTYPVRENMPFQRRMWAFERIGWYGLCLLVGLTLSGLFSKGPLSWATIELKDRRATLEYDRFLRNGTHTDLTLDLRLSNGTVATLGGPLLDAVSLESVHPQPRSMRTVGDGLELTFKDGQDHTRAHVTLGVDGLGLQRAYLRVGEETVPFWIFIFP